MKNNEYILIDSQIELDELINKMGELSLFLKSVEYLSPTEVEEDYIIAPDSLGDLKIHFLSEESNSIKLDLLIKEVSNFSIDLNYDIDPLGKFLGNMVLLDLNGNGLGEVEGKKLLYRYEIK